MSLSLIVAVLRNNELPRPVIKTTLLSYCRIRTVRYSIYNKQVLDKMSSAKTLPQIFKYVDQNVQSYKNLLKEAVAIPSVSSDPKFRGECVRMVEWTREKLKEIGARTELRDVGFQTLEGQEIKLPPVLIGELGNVSIYLQFMPTIMLKTTTCTIRFAILF